MGASFIASIHSLYRFYTSHFLISLINPFLISKIALDTNHLQLLQLILTVHGIVLSYQ